MSVDAFGREVSRDSTGAAMNLPEYGEIRDQREERSDTGSLHLDQKDLYDTDRRSDHNSSHKRNRYDRNHRHPRSKQEVGPSNTVRLEGLPYSSTIASITSRLNLASDITVTVPLHPNGEAKGMGYLRFPTVAAAAEFISQYALQPLIVDGKRIRMHFAISKSKRKDWRCIHCGFSNFATRVRCNQCGEIPNESPQQQQQQRSKPVILGPSFEWSSQYQTWYCPVTQFFYDETMAIYTHAASGTRHRFDTVHGKYFLVDERGVAIPEQKAREDKASSLESKTSTASKQHPSAVAGKKRKADEMEPASSSSSSTSTSAAELLRVAAVREETSGSELKPRTKAVSFQFAPAALNSRNLTQWKKRKPDPNATVVTKKGANVRVIKPKKTNTEDAVSPPSNETVQRQIPTAAANVDVKALQQRESNESKWLNLSKKQCLLCQRQFNKVETLQKHVESSELHARNVQVEEYKLAEKATRLAATQALAIKREEEKKKRFESMVSKSIEHEEQAKAAQVKDRALGADNLGHQMLSKMGWKTGGGLGKNGKGITMPVTMQHTGRGGLGSAKMAAPVRQAGEKHTDFQRRLAKARYTESMERYQATQCDDEYAGNKKPNVK